jgi:hypothetical protein
VSAPQEDFSEFYIEDEFHCEVCGSDTHDALGHSRPQKVSCIHMPGCKCRTEADSA